MESIRHIDKALIVAPMNDGEDWPAVDYAFRKCGVETQIINLDNYGPNTPPDETARREILTVCRAFTGQIVICSREPILVPLINDMRSVCKARFAVWNFDVRYDIKEWEVLWPLFRRVSVYYTVGLGEVPLWRDIGVNAFWLPQGLQEERYHLPESITQEDRERFECDVSFIGRDFGMHEGRAEMLDFLQLLQIRDGIKVKLWGCRGYPLIWGEEHNKAAHLSKINIAHSGWPQNDCYWSVRAYKLFAAEGFVLANAHQQMASWIPCRGPKRILDIYTSLDELEAKIKYYLEHEEERKAIAARAREWVYSCSTYAHRVEAIIKHFTCSRQFDEELFLHTRLSPLEIPGQDKIFIIAREAESAFHRENEA